MIRSDIIPGLRVCWRGQGPHCDERGKGIMFERFETVLVIYVEELTTKHAKQINLGLKKYRSIDILIVDKEDVLLDELLTSDNKMLREFALRLIGNMPE